MVETSKVTPKDIPALLAMIRKLCTFHGDRCVMGLAQTQAQFVDGPLTGIIARQGGRAVGYAAIEPHWRPVHQGPLLDIAHLFVEEPMRGRGVGTALIDAAQVHARQIGACRLVIGTSPVNPGAAATYRAMGLSEITTAPGPRFEIAMDAACKVD
ncbi:GNAT family N-acetyltransferase [Loktanella sp. Alg231-35]|uniref:GNAT family N-acetyltransferase n=1 Tax=Loktanella sp. Alg231-35 TaxID=1922220 RepID=UPI000D55C683|nr:GNAT family N-acetyltransferase [Loktanella sp. Alg231-35]